MKIKFSPRSGFTLVEIMIVVAIIGTLAAIAIPGYVRARGTAQRNSCIHSLRQIDGAKHQWALEQRKSDTATPGEADVEVYLKNSRLPVCPGGGTYTVRAVNEDPTCSLGPSLGHELSAP